MRMGGHREAVDTYQWHVKSHEELRRKRRPCSTRFKRDAGCALLNSSVTSSPPWIPRQASTTSWDANDRLQNAEQIRTAAARLALT